MYVHVGLFVKIIMTPIIVNIYRRPLATRFEYEGVGLMSVFTFVMLKHVYNALCIVLYVGWNLKQPHV